MMILTEISLTLALQDFMLVAFFAVGLYFVGKMVSSECSVCGKLAFFGGILITLGGFFKVCWKLILATTENDIVWLNNGLFVWLSCGFICLAWALWRSRKDNNPTIYGLVPTVLIVITLTLAGYFAFATETRIWFFVLLGITTIFNLWVSFQLIYRSYQNKLWLAIGLFVFNTICLLSLSRLGDQTVTLQWFKQIIGTFSQGSFAIGAWILFSRTKQN
jgi:hypothetical protein